MILILYHRLHNANCYYYMVYKLFLSYISLRVGGLSSSFENKEGKILSLSRPIFLRNYINSVQRENFSTNFERYLLLYCHLCSTKQRYFYRLFLAPNPAVQRNTNHMALRCNTLHCTALYYILYRVYRKSRSFSLTINRIEKIVTSFRKNQ